MSKLKKELVEQEVSVSGETFRVYLWEYDFGDDNLDVYDRDIEIDNDIIVFGKYNEIKRAKGELDKIKDLEAYPEYKKRIEHNKEIIEEMLSNVSIPPYGVFSISNYFTGNPIINHIKHILKKKEATKWLILELKT